MSASTTTVRSADLRIGDSVFMGISSSKWWRILQIVKPSHPNPNGILSVLICDHGKVSSFPNEDWEVLR